MSPLLTAVQRTAGSPAALKLQEAALAAGADRDQEAAALLRQFTALVREAPPRGGRRAGAVSLALATATLAAGCAHEPTGPSPRVEAACPHPSVLVITRRTDEQARETLLWNAHVWYERCREAALIEYRYHSGPRPRPPGFVPPTPSAPR